MPEPETEETVQEEGVVERSLTSRPVTLESKTRPTSTLDAFVSEPIFVVTALTFGDCETLVVKVAVASWYLESPTCLARIVHVPKVTPKSAPFEILQMLWSAVSRLTEPPDVAVGLSATPVVLSMLTAPGKGRKIV